MKVFILVRMFQGIVDSVEAYESEADAIEGWNDFVEKETYEALTRNEEDWHDFHQYNDYYGGTKIYETVTIKKGKLLDSHKVQ